jgi:hypothetical protein
MTAKGDTTRKPARFGGRAAANAEARKAVAKVEKPVARRGEEDIDLKTLTEAAQADASAPADVELPHQASKPLEGVLIAPAPQDPFQYVPAPDDVNDLEHLAHAGREIKRLGEAAGTSLAETEKAYWILTGRWLAEVQERKSYKAGKFKNVDSFAQFNGMKRHDYYRAIKHHVVYTALGELVKGALAQRTVEQLYILGKDDPELMREKYVELEKKGPVTATAVENLRRLLDASELAAKEPRLITTRAPRPIEARLSEAQAAGRIDLGLLRELVTTDKDSAVKYVEDMEARLAEAKALIG